MALGEVCCTIDISKTRRSSKTGFLFFLLLQMSLLSKVWTTETTTQTPATSLTADTMSSTMSEPASQSPTTINPESTSSSATVDQSSTTATSGSVTLVTSTQTTAFTNATVAITGVNGTDTGNTSAVNYSMLFCPAFNCTTDCYTQFMNTTTKSCQSSEYFCEIMKQEAGYTVSCSASCGVSCGNVTLSNCSVNCCNTTNCLNSTLFSMSNSVSTTVATTKPTTTTTTIKATVSTTQGNNGKKCHNIKCDGAACYKTFTAANVVMCPVGQDYCMLQKTASGTTESWQAGCSLDCRKMTVCTSTTATCYLECCNATTTASCLKLTGDVNMSSSASRGLHCPALLTASLLLLWIVKVFT